jgi:protoporphyrinogen oxidase
MVGRLRQRMSSRERGDERLGYLDGSLQSLLDALLAKLASLGVRILTGNPVASLLASQRRVEGVRLQDGTTLRSDRTLATLPTTRLVPLVEPLDAGYAESLRRIEYFGAVCTILELDRPLSQTYWLNVADPGFPFGGVIEHTNLISPEVYGGRHIAYLSRYYENSNPLATLPDAEVSRQMTEPLARIYGDGALKSILRTHVFRTQTAATVCDLGFSRKVPQVRSPLENLFIATMAHVYPDERSCNNSIRVAANACEVMGLNASAVPKGCSLSGLIGTAH